MLIDVYMYIHMRLPQTAAAACCSRCVLQPPRTAAAPRYRSRRRPKPPLRTAAAAYCSCLPIAKTKSSLCDFLSNTMTDLLNNLLYRNLFVRK